MRFAAEIQGIFDRVVTRLGSVTGIEAIALGGSRARGTADRHSDIDLGIYYDSRKPFRLSTLDRAARDLDDRNRPGLLTPLGAWGTGVDGGGWLQIGGRHVDFLYRDLVAVRRAIKDCRVGRISAAYQLGHPMGFHCQIYPGEIRCCVPLHDPRSRLRQLKRQVATYPAIFRRAMVTKHFFDATFELAIAVKPAERGDTSYVTGSLFHAAGFMTLVLYALNRQWLINEKGMLPASRGFRIRPRGFHSTIEGVMAEPGRTPRALQRSVSRMRSLAIALRATAARAGIVVNGFDL
ncbi:MAG TPA: nucleotidyltransferase domain-containing protein [Candidatus Binataceae bacterium]